MIKIWNMKRLKRKMCARESNNEENRKLVKNRKKLGLEIWNSRAAECKRLRIEQKYNLKT